MDHPFLTRRTESERIREGRTICADIMQLLDMSPVDHQLLVARCEDNIGDDRVRASVKRNATRLGLLPTHVDASAALDKTMTPLGEENHKTWRTFLTEHSLPASTAALKRAAQALQEQFTDALGVAERHEQDDGSSSYSDYSDSTETSDDSSDRGDRRGGPRRGSTEQGGSKGGGSKGGGSKGGGSEEGSSEEGSTEEGSSEEGSTEEGSSEEGSTEAAPREAAALAFRTSRPNIRDAVKKQRRILTFCGR